MKTYNLILKQVLLSLLMFPICGILYSQPNSFSWNYRHHEIDYISPEKNQMEQGPCGIFATVAAVEAMIDIYFNHEGYMPDLSESNLYSACGLHEWTTGMALPFFVSTGSVDEGSWQFPTYPVNGPPNEYYLPNPPCDQYVSYNYIAKIPGWGESIWGSPNCTIDSNEDLKKAIMDYGPIILTGTGVDQYGNRLGRALHPGGENVNHSILVTGWTANGEWEIKDSWPGVRVDRRLVTTNFFNYSPNCFWIMPVVNDNGILKYITVKNSGGTDYYSREQAEDKDQDGFYRWGLEAYPPAGYSGYYKMDFDDGDPYVIFCDGYEPMKGPYISDTTSKWLCSSGKSFTLKEFSALSNLGFTVDWNVSPANYFSSNSSGSDTTTNVIVPIPGYVGKKGKIEYRLKYNGNVLTTYKFEFYLIGPRENYVSISVLDSYGGSPENSDFYYYICPNTNYTISYNNYDQGCYTSNFSWELPYGWTTNYSYNNLISINTNDYPYGLVQIKATTSCCGSNVNLKNLYFGEAYCGEYFMSYPNPANDYVNIDIIKDKFPKEEDTSSENSALTVVDGSGIVKSRFNFRGFPYSFSTSNLPEGIYFINIQYKDIRSIIRLSVKR